MSDAAPRFGFGDNWSAYARLIDEARIDEAVRSLDRLIGHGNITDKTVLDLGCGSGLFSVAALRAGASRVTALDLDPDSVATARAVLAAHGGAGRWSVDRRDALDLTPAADGSFELVYSWGVLHHTGQMVKALERAAALVRPSGLLVVALYGKTPCCPLWALEKRLFVAGGPVVRALIRYPYMALYLLALAARGRNPVRFVRAYASRRGMSWSHDVEDWLGGLPYESISPPEAHALFDRLGFDLEREFSKRRIGLLGSGCDEYVFRRRGDG